MRNLLLRLIVLLFMVSCQNLVRGAKWTDRGNYSISWYDKSKRSFVINTPSELAGVAYLVNNGYTTFKGVTIVLGKDISLDGHEWISIGSNLSSCFQGTFDGTNHFISDVKMTKNSLMDETYIGFFSCLKGASIKNLFFRFKNFTIDIKQRTEIKVGKITGYAENCQISNVTTDGSLSMIVGEITFSDYYYFYIGGLIGEIKNCKLSNCRNQGSISTKIGALYDKDYYMNASIYLGGLVGSGEIEINSKSSINSCENLASLEAISGSSNNGTPSVYIGGIGGFNMDNAQIESCCNNAPYIICKNTGNKEISACIGGIIGGFFTSPYSSGYIHNSYSSTTNITYGVWLHSRAYLDYGGISAIYTSGTNNLYSANFSPSDFVITPYNVGNNNIPLRNGFSGDASYRKQEMKSQEFTDELNLYYTLNGENAKWYFDGSNYPCINENNASGINSIVADKTIDIDLRLPVEVYRIDGVKISNTIDNIPAGFYIIRQGNITKKIAVK